MKRDVTLREERDRELIKMYRKQLSLHLKSDSRIVRHDIIRDVIMAGKPRCHVSFEYALRVISQLKRVGMLQPKMTVRRAMWREIMGHIDDIMSHHADYSLSKALMIVLSERRASQFFISQQYAYKLIYEVVQNYKNEHRA